MKRRYIILYILLILVIVTIIFSLYITKQGLKEISQEEKKSQVKSIPYQPSISSVTPRQEKPLEIIKKQEKEPKELEFGLDQIPDDYVKEKDIKEMEDKESKEALSLGERRLNKQPALRDLKELKNRGVIIY